ncbi:NAD(P)-binding protein [Aspergillus campestris IBT 28561]|uniref:NAD(P)-binding protein n=1 Tax=Aspergillus campestris (strain IBT 28561) TaxID=1392248 RepID=A0A2I1DC06_ASPC2|nr:NAD(P)-binding protein [Aspergillus campestris IBT 28561]PKY07417.1 NAD(P)-binding protein [Aspergillus campestris IBT 28561]
MRSQNPNPEQPTRVAIVTGATSGVGVDIARDLYQRGWKVACVGRNKAAGQAVVDSLGDRAQFFRADVSDYKSQATLFKDVFKLWGRIDALCANAGVVDQTSAYLLRERENSIEDIPKEPDTSCTDVNYKGVVYGVTLATHFMRHNSPHPGGKIVVTSSIGGMFPHPTYPQYCGSKAAINMFVRDVAPILKAKDNIFINCILPGMMDTPIVPPEMTAAVSPECLTPVKTLLDAYQIFLEDTTGIAGELLECSAGKHIFYPSPEYGNGHVTKRAVTVWEPLFNIMHGENSGLPDAIP